MKHLNILLFLVLVFLLIGCSSTKLNQKYQTTWGLQLNYPSNWKATEAGYIGSDIGLHLIPLNKSPGTTRTLVLYPTEIGEPFDVPILCEEFEQPDGITLIDLLDCETTNIDGTDYTIAWYTALDPLDRNQIAYQINGSATIGNKFFRIVGYTDTKSDLDIMKKIIQSFTWN